MNPLRRGFLLSVLGVAGGIALLDGRAEAGPHRRKVRRRIRRKIRRMRRRAAWRTVAGRRLIVVPVACAVGWELMIDNRVALVQTVQPQAVVVQYQDDHSTATVPAAMENTPENTAELPGTEVEQEVEEEVDE